MSEDDSVKHEGKWTRDDLPSLPDVLGEVTTHECGEGAAAYRTAALAHLNAHHPKPGESFAVMLEDTHRAQPERDESLRKKGEAFDRAVRAERERDAAIARADQLRDERDDAVQSCIAVGRERDEWRESADKWHGEWQKIAPVRAMTRDDIEKVVEAVFDREAGYDYGSDRPWPGTEPVASAVWDYLKGDDPALFVVRESDIAAIKVERDGDGHWWADGDHLALAGSFLAVKPRECADKTGRDLIREIALARAIEAEQAVDLIEEKAISAFKVAWHEADMHGDEGNRTRRGIRAARKIIEGDRE